MVVTNVIIKMFTFVILINCIMSPEKLHSIYKEKSIVGRYLNLQRLQTFIESKNYRNQWKILGNSVLRKPIYSIKLGHGKTKILMWSQMHGNESTTTKGLLDFVNFLSSKTEDADMILSNYQFLIIPILNPDGAEAYTRINANDVDLNRDFQDLSQPESQLLMRIFSDFKPDFCFNLHDQRTIFGVGTTGKPATVSFLAPSFNINKEYDEARLQSVHMIMKMQKVLDQFLPGQIGRFDDAFNNNCVGDTFQSFKTPTVLIEAGHFQEDYEREETRKFIFIALLSAFDNSNENVVVSTILDDYLSIPQNNQNFFDIVYKNVLFNYDNSNFIANFAVQFQEVLIDDNVVFNGFISKVGDLENYFGHVEYDMEGKKFCNNHNNIPKLDQKADFSIDNKVIFVNGMIKK